MKYQYAGAECRFAAKSLQDSNWDEVDVTFVQKQKSQSLYFVCGPPQKMAIKQIKATKEDDNFVRSKIVPRRAGVKRIVSDSNIFWHELMKILTKNRVFQKINQISVNSNLF